MFNAKDTEGAKEKHGKGCPLITRIYTNEYFAVDLMLHHKIKLTASASVLLVLPPCGMVLHRSVQIVQNDPAGAGSFVNEKLNWTIVPAGKIVQQA